MNIDELTIGEAKKLAQMFGGVPIIQTVAVQAERPVIVTTAHRGVFFGYATNIDGETIALRAARLCLHWSKDVKGFMGLASSGPTSGCRIGPAADIVLRNITAVLSVTEKAAKKWEEAPWTS
jgi:hypothetical protein